MTEDLRRIGLSLPVPVGPALIVSLGTAGAARGVVAVSNPPGGATFGEPARRLLEAFAAQAAMALELAGPARTPSGSACWRIETGSPRTCTTR